MSNVQIRGPILSVQHVEVHLAFFCGGCGMSATQVTHFDQQHTNQLLGLDGYEVDSVFLRKSPTDFGVRLWRCSPHHQDTVRAQESGTDVDALKVIDIYVPDFERSVQILTEAGFSPKDAIATYTLPEGEFTEAHFWRPDNVVCALISGPAGFFRDFVTINSDHFSEPQSISAPVSDVASVLAFYADVFGLFELHRYEFTNPSFDAMVGSEKPLELAAINVGAKLIEPYLGVIDYGIQGGQLNSLKGRSRPPVRGLVGVELLVTDLDEIVQSARRFGADFVAEPVRGGYPPYGDVLMCLIEGPHGVMHHVIQKTAA